MEKSIYLLLTQLTIIAHLLFILFVISGSFFVRRRWQIVIHLSSVVWAVIAEVSSGVVCPLTALENYFGIRAGLTSYEEDFVIRYLVPIIYQENLTMNIQYLLVALVMGINIVAYTLRWKQILR